MNLNRNVNKDLLILIGSVAIMFVALMIILTNSVSRSDRNFEAIIESEQEIERLLINVNKSQSDERERDANLTKEETEQLIDDIGSIPDILKAIRNEQPQSNFTAQAEAVANIKHLINLTESINRTLSTSK